MNLHFLRFSLCVGLAWATAGCASPQSKYFKDTQGNANVYVTPGQGRSIRKVAIMPFKAPTELIGNSVSDMMVTEMLHIERYELVERGQMATVLNESELALAGLSTAKAVEIGNMLGADGVIIGTVDEYGTVAHRGRSYPVVGVSARLIHCGTGRVMWSVDFAERGARPEITLPQHARRVMHTMVGSLFCELKKSR
ncbi:MAG: CsgG/HfaB family protein [Kiritimatiellae bacterium]|nr:CsgG/HfaB family protein [Kiritimatiellia bacterium]